MAETNHIAQKLVTDVSINLKPWMVIGVVGVGWKGGGGGGGYLCPLD